MHACMQHYINGTHGVSHFSLIWFVLLCRWLWPWALVCTTVCAMWRRRLHYVCCAFNIVPAIVRNSNLINSSWPHNCLVRIKRPTMTHSLCSHFHRKILFVFCHVMSISLLLQIVICWMTVQCPFGSHFSTIALLMISMHSHARACVV